MTTVVVIVVIRKKKWLDEEGRRKTIVVYQILFWEVFHTFEFCLPVRDFNHSRLVVEIVIQWCVMWDNVKIAKTSNSYMWQSRHCSGVRCDCRDQWQSWGWVSDWEGLEGIRGCGRAPGNAMVTTSIIAELEKASTFTQDINYQDIDFHSPSALHSPQKSPHVSLLSPQLQTLFSSKLYFFPNFFFPIYCLSSSNSADPSSWLVVQL